MKWKKKIMMMIKNLKLIKMKWKKKIMMRKKLKLIKLKWI